MLSRDVGEKDSKDGSCHSKGGYGVCGAGKRVSGTSFGTILKAEGYVNIWTYRISEWLGNSRYSSPGQEGEGAKSCCRNTISSAPTCLLGGREMIAQQRQKAAQDAALHIG